MPYFSSSFIKPVISSAALLFLLAAGAVIADPPLPLLTFYKGETVVESRRMTPPEHTALMKFQHATGSLDTEVTGEKLAQASVDAAAQSIRAIANGISVTDSKDSNGVNVNVDGDFNFSQLVDAIAEGGVEIGRYAERVGKAAETLEDEIDRNSSDLDYDSIAIGEGDDVFRLSLDVEMNSKE